MPSVFVSHGAPLVVFQKERGAQWRAWGEELGRPEAVLVVSAHWETPGIVLGTADARELIYDFYGFPEELYAVKYPAPGAPALRERVRALLGDAGHTATVESERGWDHGVWTPLYHMFPDADVPVLQISLPRGMQPSELVELGRALRPLREEGILILGSGSLTHNLRAINFRGGEDAPEWVETFERWVVETIEAGDLAALARAESEAPYFRENHPTPEHYLPLLVAAGAADLERGDAPTFPVAGFEFEVLSTRSVQFGTTSA